jgi:periplasmic protein TonB
MRALIIFIFLLSYVTVFSQEVDTNASSTIFIRDEPRNNYGDEIYESFACDTRPVFPAGDSALINYVKSTIQYPPECKEQGLEGTVYVRFIITKTGTIEQPTVMRAVNPLMEEEALRVIKSLPKWTPGIKDGKPVNVWFIIPVKFKLP